MSVVVQPTPGGAQEGGATRPVSPSTGTGAALGLAAAAAFGVRAGGSRVERDIGAKEIAAELDFGHFASRRLRLVTGVGFMRSNLLTERVETEGETYRNRFYDLSGQLGISWLLASPERRVVPYLGSGVAIHALSSSFRSLTIDSRYNTNNFGLHASAGVRFRAGVRRAVVLEAKQTLVREVRRTIVTIGMDALFNDLARPRR